MALAAVVIMLAIVHIAIVGAVRSGVRESDIQALRLEALRAFVAADSGALMWIRLDAAGLLPESGESTTFSSQTILFVESPQVGEGDTVVIEGISGRARRRVALLVE
jgi:hypothetical protein